MRGRMRVGPGSRRTVLTGPDQPCSGRAERFLIRYQSETDHQSFKNPGRIQLKAQLKIENFLII